MIPVSRYAPLMTALPSSVAAREDVSMDSSPFWIVHISPMRGACSNENKWNIGICVESSAYLIRILALFNACTKPSTGSGNCGNSNSGN